MLYPKLSRKGRRPHVERAVFGGPTAPRHPGLREGWCDVCLQAATPHPGGAKDAPSAFRGRDGTTRLVPNADRVVPLCNPRRLSIQQKLACFDAYGQIGHDYDERSGAQMSVVVAMVDQLIGRAA